MLYLPNDTLTEQHRYKTFAAAHYFIHNSNRGAKIAGVIGMTSPELYDTIVCTPTWHEALDFWGHPHPEAKPKGYRNYRKRKRQEAQGQCEVAGCPNDFGWRTPKKKGYRVHKPALYNEQGGLCNGCGVHFRIRNLTVDHILPCAKGGTNLKNNLQLLCEACNCLKGAGTQAELIEKLKADGILTAPTPVSQFISRAVYASLKFIFSISVILSSLMGVSHE